MLDPASGSELSFVDLLALTDWPKSESVIHRPRCLSRNKAGPTLSHLLTDRGRGHVKRQIHTIEQE
jgi:hypothetical protein